MSVVRLPLSRWALVGLVGAICPLVIWEWVALVHLALSVHVWIVIAWVPPVATGGVMLAATALHMTPALDQRIRSYAGWLAAAGITAGMVGTGVQHYLEAARIEPHPLVALPVGGLPVVMGGLLVHLLAMVFAQRQREQAQVERLRGEAVAELAEVREAAALRAAERDAEVEHQRSLTAEAARTAEESNRAAEEAERLRKATEQRAAVAQRALDTRPHLVVDNTRPAARRTATTVTKSASPVRDAAIAWLRERHADGVDLNAIGPSKLARAIGASVHTCKKGLPQWRAVVAELAEAAG